jgi:DNA replication protein DnaC
VGVSARWNCCRKSAAGVIASVTGKAYRDLLEILDDRHGQGATLMTSQFPVNQWHEIIVDATVADAILDRLVHNA